MYQFDFSKPMWVHFIGIGGISMSGLAELLKAKGFKVTGSDSYDTDTVKRLRSHGIEIKMGQRAENIEDGMGAVVYTAAIHPDNPEYAAAESRGIPMINRAVFLGQVMKNYPVSINVSGTHGKTTTTSMVSQLLLDAGLDPTVFVGGMVDVLGGNFRLGESGNFVAEACEYTDSFLYSFPTTAVILNIDKEHLDYFKGGLPQIRESFRKFAALVPEGGLTVIDTAIANYQEIVEGLPCRVVTTGLNEEDDYYAKNISYDEKGCPKFTLVVKGEGEIDIELAVPGEHNIRNALAAIAAAHDAGVSLESAVKTMKNCKGAHRRFEYKGTLNGVTIIDDYAHSPEEIEATLKCAKNCKANRILCVFEPHTYSRVKTLFDGFVKALSLADVVVMAEVFSDREKNTYGISSKDITDKLVEMGHESYFFPTFEEIEKFFLENCIDGDLLITIGSKNVYLIGEHLLGQ